MARQPMPDVVVILPGIMGSALQKDGQDVWAFSTGALFRGLLSLGGSIKDLELAGDDPEADDLGDGVVATRLLPDLHLIPGFWRIDGYGRIVDTIRERFEVTPGENLFEFPYDWRRDNRVAARKLRRQSHDWLRRWRESSGNPDAKLVLLAHSMGGLVSRAFLELEDGWRDTRALVTFGTPYRGSVNALDFLANGFKKRIGPFKLIDLTGLLRSLTSVYQLLPTYRCYDPGDGELVRVGETTGIPGVDPERAAQALAFHRSIEQAAGEGGRYVVHPVVGIDQPTLLSARLSGGRVVPLRSLAGEDTRGDGTVPRGSSYPQEWESADRGMFSGEVHASLQNEKGVLDHVRGILTADALDLGAFRREERLAVYMDDLWPADEAMPIRLECDDRRSQVVVRAADADTGESAATVVAPAGEGEREVSLPGLPEGIYRVTAASERASVTDLLVVGAA